MSASNSTDVKHAGKARAARKPMHKRKAQQPPVVEVAITSETDNDKLTLPTKVEKEATEKELMPTWKAVADVLGGTAEKQGPMNVAVLISLINSYVSVQYTMYHWEGLEVKDTNSVRGKGLFATKEIPAGSIATIYLGKVSRGAAADGAYVLFHKFTMEGLNMQFTCKFSIDARPDEKQHPGLYAAAYIKEPCPGSVANVRMVSSPLFGLDFSPMYVVAKRQIKAGEELLWHYGPEYARGYTVGEDTDANEMPPQILLSANQVQAVMRLYDVLSPGTFETWKARCLAALNDCADTASAIVSERASKRVHA